MEANNDSETCCGIVNHKYSIICDAQLWGRPTPPQTNPNGSCFADLCGMRVGGCEQLHTQHKAFCFVVCTQARAGAWEVANRNAGSDSQGTDACNKFSTTHVTESPACHKGNLDRHWHAIAQNHAQSHALKYPQQVFGKESPPPPPPLPPHQDLPYDHSTGSAGLTLRHYLPLWFCAVACFVVRVSLGLKVGLAHLAHELNTALQGWAEGPLVVNGCGTLCRVGAMKWPRNPCHHWKECNGYITPAVLGKSVQNMESLQKGVRLHGKWSWNVDWTTIAAAQCPKWRATIENICLWAPLVPMDCHVDSTSRYLWQLSVGWRPPGARTCILGLAEQRDWVGSDCIGALESIWSMGDVPTRHWWCLCIASQGGTWHAHTTLVGAC